MRSKLNILMVCTLFGSALSADYEGLKAYKREVRMQAKLFRSSGVEQSKNDYFVIDFKDINSMDTFALEKKYGLKLSECIADGICIFQFLHAQTQRLSIREILQKETNIRSIEAYKSYNFRAF